MKHLYSILFVTKGKKLAITALLYFLFLLSPSLMKGGTISGTFTPLTDCPENLTGMCVDPATGIIYALAMNDGGFYSYTISTDTWAPLAPQPASSEAGATFLNGKIYVAYTPNVYLGDYIAVYTIATNTWTTITAPSGFTLSTGAISNDGTNIYVIGYDCCPNVFSKYVVASGEWVSLASWDSWDGDNSYGGLCYYNGYFYHHQGNGNSQFHRYHIATNSWELLTAVPNPAILGVAIDGAYYYCMGDYGETNLYSYDLGEQVWNNTLTLPWQIYDASMCVYQGSLYIIQGENATGFTKFGPGNPLLKNIEGTAISYTPGSSGAVNITTTLTTSQISGTNFASATVTIQNFETGKIFMFV